jgi:arsenite methyltransferase
MASDSPTPIHQAVQEYYAKAARESGSCCGSSAGADKIENDLYPVELLAGLPVEIANFTNGSGDPISLAHLKPGESVLDLGSGGGLDCFLAARQVGEEGHVIGVDMTPEMLARARSHAERLKSRNVEFREGFLEALPVDDGSVDVIVSNCVINLAPDKPRVFAEMFRVLKPGGRIAVSDMVTNHPLPAKAPEAQQDWCACQAGALERREYIDKLGKAGFDDIRVEPNLEAVLKEIESGRVRAPEGTSKQELL